MTKALGHEHIASGAGDRVVHARPEGGVFGMENQEEHHKTMSFQDEFRAFLTKHGIRSDEKYLWE